jgi:hypothetical protein
VGERPIIFDAESVRAILAGTKTQTRRVVKPQPNIVHAIYGDASVDTNLIFRAGDQRIHCPYGQPGDRLWVREAWTQACHPPRQGAEVFYRADGEIAPELGPWVPSIHMFRWASRITLEIVSVRVEPLQNISHDDAESEGWNPATDVCMPLIWYRSLWESINGHGSWASNPWVWVVEFKRVQP